jgi:ABC-type Mn2+/Zn2+ transport system ATPase subunit
VSVPDRAAAKGLSSQPLLDFDTRKSLLFALVAERLAAYYEHAQWMTEAQGATLAGLWLSRSKMQMAQAERRQLSDLSDQMARQIAGALSREAGLYTAHEMMEALDPNYRSDTVFDLLDECERLLREQGMAD